MNNTSLSQKYKNTRTQEQDNKITKKQRKELERQEKFAAREKLEKMKFQKKTIVWVFLILAVGFLGFVFLKNSSGQKNGGSSSLLVPTASDWVRGNLESSVILIEYSDFQCPACANAHAALHPILEKYGDKMRLVYRHFPLIQIHKNAELAARASEAAGMQGKFWEMHDKLFENQKQWEDENNESAGEIFVQYAKDLELNLDQFESDRDSPEVKEKVKKEMRSANTLGLKGTPSFFLNGELLNLKNFQELEEMIAKVIGW